MDLIDLDLTDVDDNSDIQQGSLCNNLFFLKNKEFNDKLMKRYGEMFTVQAHE